MLWEAQTTFDPLWTLLMLPLEMSGFLALPKKEFKKKNPMHHMTQYGKVPMTQQVSGTHADRHADAL
jgi:hypothetical protein